MAMNFWSAQFKARRKVVFLCILFVVMTLGAAFGVEAFVRHAAPEMASSPYPFSGGLFCIITFFAAAIQFLILCKGGGVRIAKALQAIEVVGESDDTDEVRLRNLVEEVALASSQPMPRMFVLPSDQINAFVAGRTPKDTVLVVTKGSIEKLSRDELQGVIAHEFGHIANEDLKLNLLLIALLTGFYFVFHIGIRMMYVSGPRSRSRSRKGSGAGILPLALFLAGGVGWLLGSVLRMCVSHQKEYLADACSVQYTRNPKGIIGALKKIGKDRNRDMPPSSGAYAHLFLHDHSALSGLFASHPPLHKRVAALEGRLGHH